MDPAARLLDKACVLAAVCLVRQEDEDGAAGAPREKREAPRREKAAHEEAARKVGLGGGIAALAMAVSRQGGEVESKDENVATTMSPRMRMLQTTMIPRGAEQAHRRRRLELRRRRDRL